MKLFFSSLPLRELNKARRMCVQPDFNWSKYTIRKVSTADTETEALVKVVRVKRESDLESLSARRVRQRNKRHMLNFSIVKMYATFM